MKVSEIIFAPCMSFSCPVSELPSTKLDAPVWCWENSNVVKIITETSHQEMKHCLGSF